MNQLIAFLYSLNRDEEHRDKRALAILKRGLGKGPNECVEIYPVLLSHLDDRQRSEYFGICTLIASLYAFHPVRTDEGNLGAHMREAGKNLPTDQRANEATERRFVNLLNAHRDDLPDHLRQAISIVASKGGKVNWDRLYNDLVRYQYDPESVRKQWANDFWKYEQTENQAD